MARRMESGARDLPKNRLAKRLILFKVIKLNRTRK
jgi:hypothetical protein